MIPCAHRGVRPIPEKPVLQQQCMPLFATTESRAGDRVHGVFQHLDPVCFWVCFLSPPKRQCQGRGQIGTKNNQPRCQSRPRGRGKSEGNGARTAEVSSRTLRLHNVGSGAERGRTLPRVHLRFLSLLSFFTFPVHTSSHEGRRVGNRGGGGARPWSGFVVVPLLLLLCTCMFFFPGRGATTTLISRGRCSRRAFLK